MAALIAESSSSSDIAVLANFFKDTTNLGFAIKPSISFAMALLILSSSKVCTKAVGRAFRRDGSSTSVRKSTMKVLTDFNIVCRPGKLKPPNISAATGEAATAASPRKTALERSGKMATITAPLPKSA
eukprot:CAMPEP_0197687844 /NCGR_PEP_ID=MMETSP1338-20131121/104564_1 /TAXON_ID=43686 ORGANISM="Pelagodinium beii, Strain RCC1491" /NCGR_SAMPLE_ID=MMETSP1338 /ASSEMBLY_ACC=CAM_ASM_000754 /LENGTH=127 /DNA_ID=CAMNT_0043269997 /DNA_START=31 /DNA_END=410 /DNA_ORIENTATION=-